MAADVDQVDEVQVEELILDARTKAGVEAVRAAELVERWQREEHVRRRTEAPRLAKAAAAAEAAYERAQLEALIPRPNADELVGEVEADPTELDRERVATERYAARLERESREERLKFIAYDHNCDRAEAMDWLAWENGQGPRPEPVITGPATDDDDLDEVVFDAMGNERVVRHPSNRQPRQAVSQPTQAWTVALASSPEVMKATNDPTQGPTHPSQVTQGDRRSTRCSVCQSPDVRRIEQAIASGASVRKTAAEFGLAEASLRRHQAHRQ